MSTLRRFRHQSSAALTQESDAALENPPGIGLTRRQLLGGVLSSSAVSLLVTLTHPVRVMADAVGSSPYNAEEILWLTGVAPDGRWVLRGFNPSGQNSGVIDGLASRPIRSQDRSVLMVLQTPDSAPVLVQTFDAANGALKATIRGGQVVVGPPAQSRSLTAAVSSDGTLAAVLHQTFSQTVTGETEKDAPNRRRTLVPTGPWRTFQAIELLDLRSASSMGSVRLDSPTGTLPQGELQWVDQTLAVYGLWGPPLQRPGGGATRDEFRQTMTTIVVQDQRPNIKASGRSGSSGHNLGDAGRVVGSAAGCSMRFAQDTVLQFDNSNDATTASSLEVIPTDIPGTARPFLTSVADAGDNRVLICNAGRQYAALVDALHSRVIASTRLSTSSEATRVAMDGQGVAVDELLGRVYVADCSGVKGGIWVHDLNSLRVIDHWLSSTAFDLIWASRTGSLFARPANSDALMIFDADGRNTASIQVDSFLSSAP